ncbi:MAG: adenine phosphoribosyltransferase [Erysipelotrichaceae bacterium]|nr:adenine phosphoribosyltransferase [Erysipelotrichaceae bacterium]
MNLKNYIADIPNFPKDGILFRDITPLLQDKDALQEAIGKLKEFALKVKADVIVGPEARGFIFATPVAYALNIGFVPVRKPGKFPRKSISYEYDLEYGSNTLCMLEDAIKKGQRVVIIDDLLATGGTVEAAIHLTEQLGGKVVGCAFLIELDDLKGREKLNNYEVFSLIHY